MTVTLGWPALTVIGFVVLTCLVIALGTSSTARYEFEHNGAGERQRAGGRARGSHPAGSRAGTRKSVASDAAGAAGAAGVAGAQAAPQAVDVAVRPAPAATDGEPGWWLVDDAARVVAGPFADRLDADWAALAEGLPAVSVHGIRRADGGVAPRTSPEERAFLSELGDQLDRLPRDWDAVLSDTDPLTTLVVEVAAALVEAGLPLHDAAPGSRAGGVCLVPDVALGGVLVSWRSHDRLSVQETRGAAARDAVSLSMNDAVAEVLWSLGFLIEPFGPAGTSLVTALR